MKAKWHAQLLTALSKNKLPAISAVVWIVIILASLAWNWTETGKFVTAIAETEARSSFNKDLLYRRWVAIHGGVYVPPTDWTPPNPYLAHLPNRDVITTTGKRLTLMNPAYMTRQVYELAKEQSGTFVHITSLKPIRPENAPDSWEESALHAFETGVKEVVSLEIMDGESYLRLMRPLLTEKSCLKCHANQGYKVGDIRGGISVSVPFAPYAAAAWEQRVKLTIAHLLLGCLGLVGLWVGFSRLRHYTRALRESEEQLRILMTQTPDIICFKDDQGRWLKANNAALELFSLTDVEYQGKTGSELAEFTDPIYRQAFLASETTDENAWQENSIPRSEEVISRPDGTVKVYDVIKVPIQADGTRKGLVVLGRDITERKKMEEMVQKTVEFQNLIIHIATEFINVPLEHLDEYIHKSLAVVGTFLQVDRAYVFRYDFYKGIMVNTHEWCAAGIDPAIDDLQAVPIDLFPDWVNTHKYGDTIHISSVSELPDGNLKNILQAQNIQSLITFPLIIEGSCFGFVGFDSVREKKRWTKDEISILKVLAELYTNLEKFRQTEKEKTALQLQLQQAQKLESVGRLAGGVAHDLNNLLTPILGYSELLFNDFDENDRRKEHAKQIIHAGELAREIVRQLLAFSRKQTIEMKPVDLNEVLTGLEKLLRRTIRENIAIELALSPSLPLIQGDLRQLEQVIMNLAVNAQDAMPDGGTLTMETMEIELDDHYSSTHQGVKPGTYVMLVISDTGFGMDRKTRERIFEPFFTTKEKNKGTGLGLATVYGIVKQHGGNIWVYSEPGKGTTFKIYLPVSRETDNHENNTSKDEPVATRNGNETILLVEDDKLVRGLTYDLLRNLGYTVLTAASGEEALTILDRYDKKIHLLLTDVIMPGMNGKELFAKAAPKCQGLQVIYMSGYTKKVISPKEVQEQGIAFIQKPFTFRDLATKIREVLDKCSKE